MIKQKFLKKIVRQMNLMTILQTFANTLLEKFINSKKFLRSSFQKKNKKKKEEANFNMKNKPVTIIELKNVFFLEN